MKSNHVYKNGIIEYDEIRNFIEPVKTTINLGLRDLDNFFRVDELGTKRDALRKIINDIYLEILDGDKKKLPYLASISYTPHVDGYDFRLHPVDFMNNLFKYYNLDYEIPFINLDDKYGMMCLNDYIKKYTKEIIEKADDPSIIRIMERVRSNIKSINDLYEIDINEYLEKFAIPKDILLYLSYKSLRDYKETGKEVYRIMPYEYFKYVSHMRTSQYPHTINVVDGRKVWFADFIGEYMNEIKLNYTPDLDLDIYRLEADTVIIGIDILRPGHAERELRDIVARARSNPNVDYDKYYDLFTKKMNFYSQSGYRKYIVGKYGLNGYSGFAYPNEYLVFDKFYNSDTINPYKKTILTHGEAIYTLPSDRFSIVAKTKQDIIFEKDIDPRIKKLNHNETFIERLEPIIYGPNVSTSTFEEEVEKNKQKMLINIK